MQLFSNDKDIIHRIINAILLIWSLIGLVTTLYATYNLFNLNYDFSSYTTYKLNVCTMNGEKLTTDANLSEQACKDDYNNQRISTQRRATDGLIIAVINLVIPAIAVTVINRKNNKK